jgi:DNA-binding LacI/PurR family transcriptional regulator
MAAEMLLKQLGDQDGMVGEVLLEPTFIVRQSTAPPKR